MCFGGGGSPAPPPPPPLPPAPPPPLPPQKPLPEPTPVETDINPKVKKAQSKKAGNPQAQGTQALKIPLNPDVNVGGAGGAAGGLNQ